MKKTLFLALLFAVSTALAQEPRWGQAQTLKIWDNATAPHSNADGCNADGCAKQQSSDAEAMLYLYPADSTKATGQAVVICPGGSYIGLAIDYEGYQMAQWFAANGITAAVLKYRMPNGHPKVPLEDAEQALRIMSGLEAGATGFTADKVGIVGSSAGGHLAAMVSTIGRTKPAFTVLFYPVITGEQSKTHKDSFDHLLGVTRSDSLTNSYSLEKRVDASTPPSLLLASDDDLGVAAVNSTLYYNALKENHIRASLHIYPTGGHGWGIRNDFKYRTQWQAAVLDWLRGLE